MKTALIICLLACLLDVVSTVACIDAAGTIDVETNPLARACIGALGPWVGQLVSKTIGIGLVVFVGALICRERRTGVLIALWVLAALQAFAAASNTYQLSNVT